MSTTSTFFEAPGIPDINGNPLIPPTQMNAITQPPLTGEENPFDDSTTPAVVVARTVATTAGNIFVNTLGIFTQGYKTMCEVGNKILKMSKKMTTVCAVAADNYNSNPTVFSKKLQALNDKIYNLLDGNYILVLSCDEIEAERPQYVEPEFEVYSTICLSKNLWIASNEPEIVEMVQESFILSARSKGRMEEPLIPDRFSILLFLIELMFTPDDPSYLTSTTQDELEETYSALTRSRLLMNENAINSNLSVVYDRSGRKVRIFKPKYMLDAPPGKVYPRGTSVEEIHKDFPVKGNFQSQIQNYSRMEDSNKRRKVNNATNETGGLDDYNIPISGYEYPEGWADSDNSENIERGGKTRRKYKKKSNKKSNKTNKKQKQGKRKLTRKRLRNQKK